MTSNIDTAGRYVYASGNPRNYIDPTGRDSLKDFADDIGVFAAYGFAVGAVGGCIAGGAFGTTVGPGGTIAGCVGVGGYYGFITGMIGGVFGLGYAIYERV